MINFIERAKTSVLEKVSGLTRPMREALDRILMTRQVKMYWFVDGKIYPETHTMGRAISWGAPHNLAGTVELRRTRFLKNKWRMVKAFDPQGDPLPIIEDRIPKL